MGQDKQQHPAVHKGGISRGRVKISSSTPLCIVGELAGGGSVAMAVVVSDL